MVKRTRQVKRLVAAGGGGKATQKAVSKTIKAGRALKEAVEKGEALSNPQLAKKYGISITEVERLNSFFTKQKNLKYKKTKYFIRPEQKLIILQ